MDKIKLFDKSENYGTKGEIFGNKDGGIYFYDGKKFKKINTGGGSKNNSSILSLVTSSLSGDFTYTTSNNLITEGKIIPKSSNTFINQSNFSTISGGSDNNINLTSERSIIGSGNNNTIINSLNSFIAGGSGNRISTGEYSSIIAGFSNSITPTSARSIICSGNLNSINTGLNSVIAGGSGNGIFTCSYSTIINGTKNSCQSSRSTILNGNENDIQPGADNSCILNGNNITLAGAIDSNTAVAYNLRNLGARQFHVQPYIIGATGVTQELSNTDHFVYITEASYPGIVELPDLSSVKVGHVIEIICESVIPYKSSFSLKVKNTITEKIRMTASRYGHILQSQVVEPTGLAESSELFPYDSDYPGISHARVIAISSSRWLLLDIGFNATLSFN